MTINTPLCKGSFTKYNRHPDIFYCLKIIDPNIKSILSFGCAGGEELQTLLDLYFIEAEFIDGYEIKDKHIKNARNKLNNEKRARIFDSKESEIKENYYDLVIALNSLTQCDYESFYKAIIILINSLKPNGLLVIHPIVHPFNNDEFNLSEVYISEDILSELKKENNKYSKNRCFENYQIRIFKKIC